jgi:hypothetical protein
MRLVQDRLKETAGPTATGCHLFPDASESHKTPDDLLLPIPVQPASIVQIEFLVGTARLTIERRDGNKIELLLPGFDHTALDS